jgi:hypothetical protein
MPVRLLHYGSGTFVFLLTRITSSPAGKNGSGGGNVGSVAEAEVDFKRSRRLFVSRRRADPRKGTGRT